MNNTKKEIRNRKKLSLKNAKQNILKKYYPIYTSDKRYNILYGSRGSAKSIAITQKIILNTFKRTGGDWLVCQWTYAAIKDASYAAIVEWINKWNMGLFFNIKKSPLEITNMITGKTIKFKGLDDASKIKSIVGVENVFIEEADLITEENFDILDLSMRGLDYDIKFYIAFNPGNPYIFWKEEYIDKADVRDDVFILHSTYKDNPFVGQKFINKMLYMKTNHPHKYQRDGLGQFTEKEGLVINNELLRDVKDPNFYKKFSGYKGCGLDFGSVHPQAYVRVMYDEDNNSLHIIEVKTKSDTTGVIARDFARDHIKKIPKDWRFQYADSANPDKIKDTNREVKSNFVSAKKDKLKVHYYIDFLNQLKNIFIYPSATEFKREAGKWEYVKGTDTPRKLYDDINDAIRYALQPIILANIGGETSAGRLRKAKR